MKKDQLSKGRIPTVDVGIQFISAPRTVAEVIVKQDCDPAAAHILGRGLLAALMNAATLGPDERINVRWSYAGRLKTVLVDAGADGTVRGLIHPAQLSDTEDLEELYGESGEVRLVRSRKGTVLSSGTIHSCFLDVVDDLAAFLCISDQVETSATAMIAFTDDPKHPVRAARGIMMQALPGCDLEAFQTIRERLRTPAVRDLLGQLDETEQLRTQLAHLLMPDQPLIHWSPAATPVYRCTCGPDKMDAAIRCLSYQDRIDIVQKAEPVSIQCHFCNQRYTLSIEDCIRAWNHK